MGIATVLIGCLPTYGQVGILAPILLVIIRMIQGLAFGAEWGGAVMMTFEHAPWKKRGRFAAIPQAGNPLGITLANAAFLLSASLQTDWAWRLPFLASAVLIVVGLVVRMRLEESPEFEHTKATGAIVKNPGHRRQERLAQHPAGDLPAHRGELRLLRHGHLPALLHHPEQRG